MTPEPHNPAEINQDAVRAAHEKWAPHNMRLQDTEDLISTYLAALPQEGAAVAASTPAARWREEGKPDPHGERFNRERAALMMGDMTDDEIANEVFLYDHRMGLKSMVYLTAAKERIRWLSRRLVDALATPAPDAARKAVLAEREACALTVQTWQRGTSRQELPCCDCGNVDREDAQETFAAAIRRRPAP